MPDEEGREEQPYHPEVQISSGKKERFEQIHLQFLQGVPDNIAQRRYRGFVWCLQPENLSENHSAAEKLETICGHYLNSLLKIDDHSLKEWGEFVEFTRHRSALQDAKSL